MGHEMKRPRNFRPFGFPGPYSVIEMGGMFTILKVREDISDYKDPGWYAQSIETKTESTPDQKNIPTGHHF
jgi:hypothetical protein